MCEWLNFGTFFKFPCIVRIYAWFFMHCRNHHSDSHANHVIIGAYSAPSHYLNQCWFIVDWALMNKLQWNFNRNTKFFIHKNASENIVCEMAVILFRGRWVNNMAALVQVMAVCCTTSDDLDLPYHQGSFCVCTSQWVTTLQCNIVSHWLGTCTKWSLFHMALLDYFELKLPCGTY